MAKSTRLPTRHPLGLLLALSLGLGMLVALSVLVFGQVQGVELSPLTLQQRSYHFFQLPLVQWQISPASREDESSDLPAYLRQQGWLPAGRLPPRWDVARVTLGGRQRVADPLILCQYLNMVEAKHQPRWLGWSAEHTEIAAHFWPVVQEVAYLEAYELIPELFAIAETAHDPGGFQRLLDLFLATNLAEMADDYAAARQPQRAMQLYQAALKRPQLAETQRRNIETRQRRLARP